MFPRLFALLHLLYSFWRVYWVLSQFRVLLHFNPSCMGASKSIANALYSGLSTDGNGKHQTSESEKMWLCVGRSLFCQGIFLCAFLQFENKETALVKWVESPE